MQTLFDIDPSNNLVFVTWALTEIRRISSLNISLHVHCA